MVRCARYGQQRIQPFETLLLLLLGVEKGWKPEQQLTAGCVDTVSWRRQHSGTRPPRPVPPAFVPSAPPQHEGPAPDSTATWLMPGPFHEQAGVHQPTGPTGQMVQFPKPQI